MKKTMPFKGKESYKEELAEGKALASGRMTPAQYASKEAKEGYANGGMVKGYADGGAVEADDTDDYPLMRQQPGFLPPNTCDETGGPGVRSWQDYKK
jgi:hypothetical protein